MSCVLARLVLVVIAVLALGWLGVLVRDREVGQAAFDRIQHDPHLPSPEFAHEIQRLKDAELLNPETRWDLYRGSAWQARNRSRWAARVIEGVVRREPDNLEAWVVLGLATKEIDPRRSAQAERETARLNPLGAR